MKRKSRAGTDLTKEKGAAERPKDVVHPWIPDWAILLIFAVLLLAQTILSVREKSSTFDEIYHLPAGYLALKYGDYSLNPAHPPLVEMLGALPLLFVEVKMPPRGEPLTSIQDLSRFLYQRNDADRLLFLGRAAVLPLTLLLGLIVFLWTKRLFGRGAAVFALLLFSFEPNILAHAPLVTTDMGAACFIFLTLYSFYRLAHRVSIFHVALAGLSLGLALVAKFSTLQLLPILLPLGIGVVLAHHTMEMRLPGRIGPSVEGRPKKFLVLLLALLGMGLVAYVTIWMPFRFRFEGVALPGQAFQAPWDQVWPDNPAIRRVVWWMKDAKVLPEAYLFGLSVVPPSLKRPYYFLMGQRSTQGWWYYFIVTFGLKTPLPFLLLLLAVPVAVRPLWRKDPVAVLSLLIPVLIYFGIASVSRLNIGHRHILPIYPFLFVLAGALVPWARQQRAFVKGGVAVLAGWFVVSSLAIFPHYLAYFNELVGGPRNGYKYLVDSNLDWGQDLKGLKRYMEAHGITRIWLSYFGSASPDYYKIAYNLLPSFLIVDPSLERERTSYVAISATNLQAAYLEPLGFGAPFEGFKQQQPIATIGYSIFLYRFE